MHQTSVRPAPLSFLLPPTPQTPFGIDRRKDVGLPPILPQINQSRYREAPVRVGLRTPPEDDMHATYPTPQYNTYKSRQNETYPGLVNASRTTDYDGSAIPSRQLSIIEQIPGAPAPRIVTNATTFVKSELPSWQAAKAKPQCEPFHSTALTTLESESTRKPQAKRPSTTDTIHPSLQIPKSINDSGASLAEFAAQVILNIST